VTGSIHSTEAGESLHARVAPQFEEIDFAFDRGTRIRTPTDLADHHCINLRFLTHGGLDAWEFEKRRRELRAHVDGQLVFNYTKHALQAALDGFGVAYVPEDRVSGYIGKGRLVRVLEDGCPPFPGYHLYYPSRRRPSQAFGIVVEALRYG